MMKAFAPRDAGGCSRVLLSIVLMGAFPLVVKAQAGGPPQDAAAQPVDPPAAQAAEGQKPATTVETFRDPRAAKMLENKYPQLGKAANRVVLNAVKAAAAGGNVTRQDVEGYVDHWIYDLTNRNNIKAIIDTANPMPVGAAAQHAIQNATNSLIEPILTARVANNAAFLRTYSQVLLEKLPPLFEHHLLTRIEAMIVLSQTGTPDAVDTFIKQLENRNQTVWVALWAARGLTNIQQLSDFNLDTGKAIKAAKAVSDFLEAEKDLPWPVQYRALEALGALRQGSTIRPANGQPEMAMTATQFLTDPDARLEVRAEAGWSLGMLQVQAGIAEYNYSMIAHSIGELAATLGGRIREIYPKNATQAEALSALLMSQVFQAFAGVPKARDSGLLNATHPNANKAKPFMKQVSDKTKPVTAAALKLVREPSGRSPQNLKDLDGKVAELKAWLDQNRPANAWLVPKGPVFPLVKAPARPEP